jgi:hypothetical protein
MAKVLAEARNDVVRANASTKSPGAILGDAAGGGPQGRGQDARVKPEGKRLCGRAALLLVAHVE